MQNKILIILKTKLLFLVLLEMSFCIWATNQVFASAVDSLHPDIKKGLDTEMRGSLESFISQDKKSIIRGAADTSILAGEDERREAESFGSGYDQKEAKELGDSGGSNLLSQHDFGKEMFEGESHKAKLSYDDPMFSKHKGLIKHQNLSNECEELLGRESATGEVAGDTDLPEFVETTRKERVPGFKFDYKSCEELKNQYKCSKKLSVKCKRFGSNPLKIINKSFPEVRHSQSSENIRIYHTTNSYYTDKIRFTFDINQDVEITSFYINRIKSQNRLKIYFNNKEVFEGPRLSQGLGSWLRTIVSLENDNLVGEEVKGLIKEKGNEIFFERSSLVGEFSVDLSITAKVKTCAEWEENWEESCVHQK